MKFRYADSKRDAVGVTLILFSVFYFVSCQLLIKPLFAPNLGVTIRSVEVEGNEYIAVTDREAGKQSYKMDISKSQYRQFIISGYIQMALFAVYAALFVIGGIYFNRHFPDEEAK